MHTRRPMQEEHSKPRGKPALAGGLALLLIAISMAFQFYLQSRIESDQLGQGSDADGRDARRTG